MITGFNKKELRLFEKYRKQYNKSVGINSIFGSFIHEIEIVHKLTSKKPPECLINRNRELMYKHAKPVKMPSVIKFNPDLIF